MVINDNEHFWLGCKGTADIWSHPGGNQFMHNSQRQNEMPEPWVHTVWRLPRFYSREDVKTSCVLQRKALPGNKRSR